MDGRPRHVLYRFAGDTLVWFGFRIRLLDWLSDCPEDVETGAVEAGMD